MDFTSFEDIGKYNEGLIVSGRLDEGCSPPAAVIFLSGILDNSNTGDFAAAIMDFFSGHWKRNPVVLDISGLSYISSSGIGSFTTVRMQCSHKESPLFLMGMNEKVRTVFDQLGFSSFFTIIDSLDEVET